MQPPRTIGPYTVHRELGRGGMGVVFEVAHAQLEGRRALKLIRVEQADEVALKRFGREAELLARVQHPGIVRVHELGRASEGPYLVMELVEGENLKALCRTGPLPPEQAVPIARALADAVAALHRASILHRDLKPENVILRPSGQPVLLDFGIARALDVDRLTQTGAVIGSPAYMSPEQADGMSPADLDARTDVYGVGTVLFHMLAGRPPFDGGSMVGMLKKVLVEEPNWPKGLAPDLETLLRKSMAKDREHRYETVAELRCDLDRFLAGEAVVGQAPPIPRKLGALAGAAVLALLSVSVGVFASLQRAPAAPPDPAPVVAVSTHASPAGPQLPPRPGKRYLVQHTPRAPDLPPIFGLFWGNDLLTVPKRLRTRDDRSGAFEAKLWTLDPNGPPACAHSWSLNGLVRAFAVAPDGRAAFVVTGVRESQQLWKLVPGADPIALAIPLRGAIYLLAVLAEPEGAPPDRARLVAGYSPFASRAVNADLFTFVDDVLEEPVTLVAEGPLGVVHASSSPWTPDLFALGIGPNLRNEGMTGSDVLVYPHAAAGDPLRAPNGVFGNPSSVAFSRDGASLVVGTASNRLFVWPTSLEGPPTSHTSPRTAAQGGLAAAHAKPVTGVAYIRSDTGLLSAGSEEPTVGEGRPTFATSQGPQSELTEWALAEPNRPQREITDLPFVVRELAVSRDGKWIALSDSVQHHPGAVELWSLDMLERAPLHQATPYSELVKDR